MSFNLIRNKIKDESEYIRKYVEAMGTTHHRYRDSYHWWSFEELASSPPDTWAEWVESDPTLLDVLNDARRERDKWLHKINVNYGVSMTDAPRLLKTYIGYHPAYGGYLCQIGPYISDKPKEGSNPYSFAYFTWRKRKCTGDNIAASLKKNIDIYMKRFNILFEDDDFKMILRANEKDYDPDRPRQENRITVGEIPSLNREDPNTRSFLERAPVAGAGTYMTLNNKGYVKLLRNFLGPWYEEAVREKAAKENISEQDVVNALLTDEDFLRKVYNSAYEKYMKAREAGVAAAFAINPPPRFNDNSLARVSGQQGYTELKYNRLMAKRLQLQMEVLSHLRNNLTNPEEIAAIMNRNPKRIMENEKLVKQRDPKSQTGERKSPVWITPEIVQKQIAIIRADQQQSGIKDPEQYLQTKSEQIQRMETEAGYRDLRTAFEMAALFFSTMPRDPLTEATLGSPNIIFNPSANFENFTNEDLKNFYNQKRNADAQKAEQIQIETPEQKKDRLRIEREIGVVKLPPRPVAVLVGQQPGATPATAPVTTEGEAPKETEEAETPVLTEETGIRTEPEVEPEAVTPKPTVPSPKPAPPLPKGKKKKTKVTEPPSEEEGMSVEDLLANTVKNLIKIAEELDSEGNSEGAEEIHNIIRRHGEGLL